MKDRISEKLQDMKWVLLLFIAPKELQDISRKKLGKYKIIKCLSLLGEFHSEVQEKNNKNQPRQDLGRSPWVEEVGLYGQEGTEARLHGTEYQSVPRVDTSHFQSLSFSAALLSTHGWEKNHLCVCKEALPRPTQGPEHCLLFSSQSERHFIYGALGSVLSRIFLQELVRVSPKPNALLIFTWFTKQTWKNATLSK